LSDVIIKDLKSTLLKCITILSSKAHSIRVIKSKKEYARIYFIESSDGDWHKSKYVYVISALNVYLYEINAYLSKYLNTLEEICYCLASLSGS
jgi:hypothetical protein